MTQQDIGRAVLITIFSCFQAQYEEFGHEKVARSINLPPDLRDALSAQFENTRPRAGVESPDDSTLVIDSDFGTLAIHSR